MARNYRAMREALRADLRAAEGAWVLVEYKNRANLHVMRAQEGCIELEYLVNGRTWARWLVPGQARPPVPPDPFYALVSGEDDAHGA